jgi:2-polyprenyl-6-methoxyphenol hydroxylase-like FAD-dependent oxidoreductase
MSPIVIVGSGPTGATLALLLAQQGIPVTLVEASSNFRRIFRGEALMPSGLDALDHLGLLPIVKQIPHRVLDAWEFIIEDRSLFRVTEPFRVTELMQFSQVSASLLESDESANQSCTLVSQPALLEQLLQRISKFPHCQLIQGTAVQDVLWQSDTLLNQDIKRVTGVRLANGSELKSSLVIGADGRNSVVRQAAGLSLVQQDLNRKQPTFSVLFSNKDKPLEFSAVLKVRCKLVGRFMDHYRITGNRSIGQKPLLPFLHPDWRTICAVMHLV